MQEGQNYIKELLRNELLKPLPGFDYQRIMLPKSRLNDIAEIPKDVKKGAVLILLYKELERLMTAFIERTDDGGVHSRQISFPGGKYEKYDKDLFQTALREAKEEVGIEIAQVTVLGNLSTLYIPVSNFTVFPIIGYYTGIPTFVPNPLEVADIITVPVADLIDENNRGIGTVDVRGTQFEVPVFKAGKYQIWGATAMILSEFVQVLKNANGVIKSKI